MKSLLSCFDLMAWLRINLYKILKCYYQMCVLQSLVLRCSHSEMQVHLRVQMGRLEKSVSFHILAALKTHSVMSLSLKYQQ